MKKVKLPNVAGSFYPERSDELKSLIFEMFDQAKEVRINSKPVMVIAPHAGIIFSGPVAASAYIELEKFASEIKKVAVLSPSHYFNLLGVALSTSDYFRTPLGDIPIEHDDDRFLNDYAFVSVNDDVFEEEHSLEVQLPFLQESIGEFKLLPCIVGKSRSEDIALFIEDLIDNNYTVIISTDLSHFHLYDEAVEIDTNTSTKIEKFDYEGILSEEACGHYPLCGALRFAEKFKLNITRLDYRNSGDTAGDKSRVVGYGSWAVTRD